MIVGGRMLAAALAIAAPSARGDAPARAPGGPLDPALDLVMARLERGGRVERARAELVQLAAARADLPEAWFLLAQLDIQGHRWRDAADRYARFLLGRPAGTLARIARVELELVRAIAAAPLEGQRAPRARLALARAREALVVGDLRRAGTLAGQAADLDPAAWEPYAVGGVALDAAGRTDGAAELLGRAYERAPADARGEIALRLERALRRLRAAELRARASTARERGDLLEAGRRLADAWERSGARADAEAAIEALVAAGAATEARLVADGLRASAAGGREKLLSALEARAPVLGDRLPERRAGAAAVATAERLAAGGDGPGAARALAGAPPTPLVLRAMAKANAPEAERALAEAAQRGEPWSFLPLGALRLRRGDGAGAAAALQRAVSADPGSIDARVALAAAYVVQGRAEAAEALARATARLAPEDPGVQDVLGRAAAALLRWADAEAAYRSALRRAAYHGSLHRRLAQVLLAKGDAAEAGRELATAARLGEPPEALARAGGIPP